MAIAVNTRVRPISFPAASASMFARTTGSRNAALKRRRRERVLPAAVVIRFCSISMTPLHHVPLAGADVVAGFDRQHEHPAVADLSRPRRGDHRLNHLLHYVVG